MERREQSEAASMASLVAAVTEGRRGCPMAHVGVVQIVERQPVYETTAHLPIEVHPR